MEPRRSLVPPITGLVQVPVGAEGSAPFHPAAFLPTDNHVGVHHQGIVANLLGQPLGACSCLFGRTGLSEMRPRVFSRGASSSGMLSG